MPDYAILNAHAVVHNASSSTTDIGRFTIRSFGAFSINGRQFGFQTEVIGRAAGIRTRDLLHPKQKISITYRPLSMKTKDLWWCDLDARWTPERGIWRFGLRTDSKGLLLSGASREALLRQPQFTFFDQFSSAPCRGKSWRTAVTTEVHNSTSGLPIRIESARRALHISSLASEVMRWNHRNGGKQQANGLTFGRKPREQSVLGLGRNNALHLDRMEPVGVEPMLFSTWPELTSPSPSQVSPWAEHLPEQTAPMI